MAQPAPWPKRRWWITLALVYLAQLGFIFALSDRHPIRTRTARPPPTLHMVTTPPAELLALTDPTLFALPHRQGFAGLAWLKIPRIEFQSFDWSEPPNWLNLDSAGLGADFSEFNDTNALNALPGLALLEPDLLQPRIGSLIPVQAASTWRLEGGLSRRRVLTTFQLPPRPNSDLLTNSIVQIVVDAEGRLLSVPVLLSSSGSKESDEIALEQAGNVRFEPQASGEPRSASTPMSDATWGKIIFEWKTVPAIVPSGPSPQ